MCEIERDRERGLIDIGGGWIECSFFCHVREQQVAERLIGDAVQ